MSDSILQTFGLLWNDTAAIGVPVLVELVKVIPVALLAVVLAYLDRRRIVGRFLPWMATQGLRTFVLVYAVAAVYWLAVRQPWQ